MARPSQANDPENFPIAIALLEAYQEEWGHKQTLLDWLQSDEGKRIAPLAAPQIGQHYERQTIEERAWWQQASATAAGVAAAIQFALQERFGPLENDGKS